MLNYYNKPSAFKYRTFDREGHIWELLEEGKVYFPTLDELDDPNEGRWIVSMEGLDSATIEVFSKFCEHFRCSNNVFCLSESPAIPMMWSKYAAANTGICIEFALVSHKQGYGFPVKESDEPLPVFKMQYLQERTRLNLLKLLNSKEMYDQATELLTWKHSSFKEERECRVWGLPLKRFYTLPPGGIKAIYLRTETGSEEGGISNVQRICNLITKDSACKGAKLYRMENHLDYMEAKQISPEAIREYGGRYNHEHLNTQHHHP